MSAEGPQDRVGPPPALVRPAGPNRRSIVEAVGQAPEAEAPPPVAPSVPEARLVPIPPPRPSKGGQASGTGFLDITSRHDESEDRAEDFED
jgi:hypothetical protein